MSKVNQVIECCKNINDSKRVLDSINNPDELVDLRDVHFILELKHRIKTNKQQLKLLLAKGE